MTWPIDLPDEHEAEELDAPSGSILWVVGSLVAGFLFTVVCGFIFAAGGA